VRAFQSVILPGGIALIEYSLADDVLYVNISDGHATVVATKSVDDRRLVSLAEDGSVIGVEFACLSEGIDLDGLPERERIEESLQSLAKVLAVTLSSP
jgi:uncharacterized protein YuzE